MSSKGTFRRSSGHEGVPTNVPSSSEDNLMALLVNVSQVHGARALNRFVKRVSGGTVFPHSLKSFPIFLRTCIYPKTKREEGKRMIRTREL
jgi:hypothetical protein